GICGLTSILRLAPGFAKKPWTFALPRTIPAPKPGRAQRDFDSSSIPSTRLTCMLPALDRSQTVFPPPLTGPFKRSCSFPTQTTPGLPPPGVSPCNGPCHRAKCKPPPHVCDFTSPVDASTSVPPPAVASRALKFAGTVIVYFASFELRPSQDELLLLLFK